MSRLVTDILGEIAGGALAERATDELAEATAAVIETRKAATVTITIKITPNGENSVFVDGEVKAKVPKTSMPRSIFFTDAGGNLLRNDPTQPELPFKVAKTA